MAFHHNSFLSAFLFSRNVASDWSIHRPLVLKFPTCESPQGELLPCQLISILEVNESETTSFSFVKSEHKIIEFLERKRYFSKKSLEQTKKGKPLHFLRRASLRHRSSSPRPPLLASERLKDIVPRYFTMKGRYVERRFGWDCHGLTNRA